MAFEHPGQRTLDYFPCRYGQSKLLFRGPRRRLRVPYAVFLGGTETYGKFIPKPFPDLVEAETGLMSVNLGCVNAGVDAYLTDPDLLNIAARARVTVIQVMGSQNLTNRYYSVHPRRNDRFVKATALLRSVFREVDFTDFAFTRHLLGALHDCSPERHALVVEELRHAWLARMSLLIEKVGGRTVLLWMSDHAPPINPAVARTVDPLFVDAGMIAEIRTRATAYVEVVSSAAARAEGTAGMAFAEMEAPAAAALPGPRVHAEVAAALVPVLQSLAAEAPG